jgi:hypothetical protein
LNLEEPFIVADEYCPIPGSPWTNSSFSAFAGGSARTEIPSMGLGIAQSARISPSYRYWSTYSTRCCAVNRQMDVVYFAWIIPLPAADLTDGLPIVATKQGRGWIAFLKATDDDGIQSGSTVASVIQIKSLK